MAKKLIVNCGDCDARFVKEETLQAYESIVINSGDVMVTQDTKDLLNRYGVTINCGNISTLDADVTVSKINGSTQIKSGDVVPGRTYLKVNGSLDIGSGTAEVLKQYVGIKVNGSVTCPESVSPYLGMMKVNGSTTCYPDGAIVLKRNAVIDRLFALRARKKLYWAGKRMIMVDPQLDGAVLADKGATFSSREVILAESKVEQMVELIDEKAQIVIVPDGTSVITDDLTLNELARKKYGNKLYVTGTVTVDAQAGEYLAELEYLNIQGGARVPENLKDALLAAITEMEGEVKVVKPPKGRQIQDKMALSISKWLLEQEKDGLSVSDCMRVTLDEEIPNEMILQKLEFSDCMEIKCSPEQEAAVAAVSTDVMAIGGLCKILTAGDDLVIEQREDPMGIGDMVKGALGLGKELLNTKVINAGDYVL